MKILIFNDLFNEAYQGSLGRIKKVLLNYNIAKLQRLINRLKQKNKGNIDIHLINYHKSNSKIIGVNQVTLFSDLRHKLTRENYLEIVNYVKKNIKRINKQFIRNLDGLKYFNIQDIQFENLLESHLIRFFNNYIG